MLGMNWTFVKVYAQQVAKTVFFQSLIKDLAGWKFGVNGRL